jgi:hypothetical protein
LFRSSSKFTKSFWRAIFDLAKSGNPVVLYRPKKECDGTVPLNNGALINPSVQFRDHRQLSEVLLHAAAVIAEERTKISSVVARPVSVHPFWSRRPQALKTWQTRQVLVTGTQNKSALDDTTPRTDESHCILAGRFDFRLLSRCVRVNINAADLNFQCNEHTHDRTVAAPLKSS